MRSKFFAATLALLVGSGVTGASTPSWSQQSGAMEDLIDGIIQDVIGRTVEAAEEEIRRSTGVDLSRGGYNRDRTYEPLPSDASDKSRRELRKLQEKHDRKLIKLDAKLRRELEELKAEFKREVEEKHVKLEEEVKEAYAEFDEKVADENDRFDEKREEILREERDD